jgi:hypothetical protein
MKRNVNSRESRTERRTYPGFTVARQAVIIEADLSALNDDARLARSFDPVSSINDELAAAAAQYS